MFTIGSESSSAWATIGTGLVLPMCDPAGEKSVDKTETSIGESDVVYALKTKTQAFLTQTITPYKNYEIRDTFDPRLKINRENISIKAN